VIPQRADAAHPTTAAARALRQAIEADDALGRPAADFSPDGGVSVFDALGRSARLQPLGQRTRISLADRDRLVAEAEVDGHALISRIGSGCGTYHAVVIALDHENGRARR